MILRRYLYGYIIFFSTIYTISCARPTFNPLFQISSDGSTDSRTGLPLHTTMKKSILNVTKEDILKRAKSMLVSSPSYMAIDQLKSLVLKATTKLNGSRCIALNAIESLQSVTCVNRTLTMTFDTSVNSAYTYEEWMKQKVEYINGGQEWGCKNSTTGEPIVIMMKIMPNTFKLIKTQIIVNTTYDTNITPIVCFVNLTLNMTTEQESPKSPNSVNNSPITTTAITKTISSTTATTATVTPINEKLLKDEVPITTTMLTNQIRGRMFGCFSYCSYGIYLYQQPLSGGTYQIGQQIILTWSLNGDFDGSILLEIILKRTSWTGVATNMYTWTVSANQYRKYITIPPLQISKYETYFFDFYWTNWCRCVPTPWWKSTNNFRIPTAPYIVVNRVSPASLTTYFPGETIRVQWEVRNAIFPSNIQVSLQFKRSRWYGDEKIANVWVWPSQGYHDYRIPTDLEKQDIDDKYYIRLDWYNCPWISYLDTYTSDSNYFYVPTKPIIYPQLPAIGDSYRLGDTVRITWRAKNFDSISSSRFTITLKRYRSFMWDETIYSLPCTNPSSELCFNQLLSGVEPSVADFYYQFDWCYVLWPFSCSQNGNYFQIPVHVVGGWNYNLQLDRASSQKTIFHADCSSNVVNAVRRLCNENQRMSIDLLCTNCYLKYDYSILRLDLSANGGVLGTMNIKFNSTTTVNIELLLTANYVYQKSDVLSLAQIPLLGFGFSIFSISFRFGYFLDIDLPYDIQLNAMGSLSAGLQYTLFTDLMLNVIGTTSTKTINMNLVKKNYPIQGSLKANFVIDIALRPSLRMEAVIFSIALSTEGYLRYQNQFQYPPFPGITSNVYDYNPFSPSIYHYSYPADACSTQHLLRYHVQFGLRKTLLTFDVTISSISTYVSTSLQKHNEWPIVSDSNVYELVSGCFFKTPFNDSPQPAELYLDIPYDSSSSFSEYLATSITFDLAKVLNIDPLRILYDKAELYYDQISRKMITHLFVSLLPSVTSEISDPNVRSLANTLLQSELNLSSVLYTGTTWLKQLVRNLTLQSNIITGIITTTTTTTTATTNRSTTSILITQCPPIMINATILRVLIDAPAFSYIYYQDTYRAISNRTILAFGFRQDPSYWALDDISVTSSNSTNNLIINGGFETGSLSPFSTCATSGMYPYGTVSSSYARTGNYSYYDGTTGSGDYLLQTFTTIPQREYNISFWLKNLGSTPNRFNVTIGSAYTTDRLTTTFPLTTQQWFNSSGQTFTQQTMNMTTRNFTMMNNLTTTNAVNTYCSIPSTSNNSIVTLLSLVDSTSFNYTYFRYTYRATSNLTTLTFAFRQDRSYWCLDDITITMNNTNNISYILNGGFELGSLSFYSLCTSSGGTPSGYVHTRCPYSGLYSYYDGSYAPGDYLSQTFTTVSRQQYQISFWLQNLGSSPNSLNVTIGPAGLPNVTQETIQQQQTTTISTESATEQSTNNSNFYTTSIPMSLCTMPSLNSNLTTVLLSRLDAAPFNYTYFQCTYRATSNLTTLTFAFRQDPSYWCLDDIMVIPYNTSGNTSNLIVNGGFEKGNLTNYSLCASPGLNPSGSVYAACAHTGNYSFRDGSYASGDYLSQTFATVPQRQYQISFWLQNLGSTPNFVNVTATSQNTLSSSSSTTTRVSTTISTIPIMNTSNVLNVCPTLSANSTTTLLSLVNSSQSNYTYYQYNYRATSNRTLLLFAFRNDPAYWCLDNISVKMNNNSTNLLINGDFETGQLTGFSICNTNSSVSSGGVVPNQCGQNSTYSFLDGSYLNPDYLWQIFTTFPQQQYQVSFWLTNLGSPPNSFKVIIGPYNISDASTTTTTRVTLEAVSSIRTTTTTSSIRTTTATTSSIRPAVTSNSNPTNSTLLTTTRQP